MALAVQDLGLQHLQAILPQIGNPGERQVPHQWQALTSELSTLTSQLSTLLSHMSKIATEFGLVQEGPASQGTQRKGANPPLTELRYCRKMRHWTQADLADRLYQLCSPEEIKEQGRGVINANMVGGWERGEHLPSLFWQGKLCEVFGTTANQLGLLQVQDDPKVKGDTGTQRKGANPPLHELRYRRKMRHWTQADLADELYQLCSPEEIEQGRGVVNAGMVGGWERGKHLPSPFWQKKLCLLFDTTPNQLGLLRQI
jgi:transcriptional regulator with XRE-family HTH domain